MKTSKRLLSLLLALTMVLSLMGNVTVSAWADDLQTTETGISNQENKQENKDPVPAGQEGDTAGGSGDSDSDANTNGDNNANGGQNDTVPGQTGQVGADGANTQDSLTNEGEDQKENQNDEQQSEGEEPTPQQSDDPVYTFYIGKDYTDGYPTVTLYNAGNEAQTLTKGEIVKDYQTYTAQLPAGRYHYQAETADGKALGGMELNLPTEKNVDGGTGGGTDIYLRCVSFYTDNTKKDETKFTAAEFSVRVDCPGMKCQATMGEAYTGADGYAYYPAMLYAAGNACLYNYYTQPQIDGYVQNQTKDKTISADSASAITEKLEIKPGVALTVTVPTDTTFSLYFQWNNFNTTEIEQQAWTVNGDMKTAVYFISSNRGNYTWRLSEEGRVTQAGWLANTTSNELNLSRSNHDDRISHDFSSLGSTVADRDEADLQVNLDPSGYKAISGTTRVRAYRLWQIINSDTANIMVEPDFHWNILGDGDAKITTVNGGNAGANWADITPGAKDSIITVFYDSVDVDPDNYNTHGGFFPATDPKRVGVMVVGGTGVTHGSADAKLAYNSKDGATDIRLVSWDYNYDTWFYEAKETNPSLDFTVSASGSATVEYAFVTADSSLSASVTAFAAASHGEGSSYSVPLAGIGKGGTVIIRMTDATGVSYRLVRVARVAVTVTNVSNPGENVMPGDQVKLSFDGLYRGVDKISGVFNPTILATNYSVDGEEYMGRTPAQYMQMDTAAVTVTIPESIDFADASVADVVLTNGYTSGSMFCGGGAFGAMYKMTDTGVGTDFNAGMYTFYANHYPDVVVPVHQKVSFNVKLNITDESGAALSDVSVVLTGPDGKAINAEEGLYKGLGYGTYSYTLGKDGYARVIGSFKLSSDDVNKMADGVLTITVVMSKAAQGAWNGKESSAPTKGSGTQDDPYQISTAAELAWFAQEVNGGETAICGKLTNDIDLGSYDWTPIGNNSKQYAGTFDGNGKMVKNLYINSTAQYQGLFGYLNNGTIKSLGVTGSVTTTDQYAGSIAARVIGNSVMEDCYSAVDVIAKKYVGGVVGLGMNSVKITNCYNVGDVTATGSDGYVGGIAACGLMPAQGPTLSNCYNAGIITAAAKKAVGPIACTTVANKYTDCYYLEGSSPVDTVKRGTAKTADELKTLIAANQHPFNAQMLSHLKSWDGTTTTEPAKDANGVYQIGTAAELAWFAKAVNEGQYTLNAVLTADIDLENNPWTPIGNNTVDTAPATGVMYKGVFDGQSHVVSNLYINNTDNKQGLFSYVNGTVRNLGVTGSVTITGKYAGGIAGYLSSGKIENCYSDVTIFAGIWNAGGIAGGGNANTTISYCYNAGDVTASGVRVGGIVSCAAVGFSKGPKLDNCYNIGSVNGKSFVGGIASINKDSCFGANLYYLDTCVTGTSYGKGTAKTAAELLTLLGAAAGDDLQTALFNKWKGQVSSADDEAVKAVIAAINAIPQTVSLSNNSKTKIIEAEKLYNALTAAQQAKVTNAQKLRDARTELDKLEADQAAADQAAADAVIGKINAIGEVTLEKEAAIKEARSAYNALERQQQKNLVKNAGALDKLEAAETTLAQLKEEMVAVNATIEWIDRIDDPVTLESEEYLTKLRAYYEKLTKAQKEKVTNYDKLVEAEKQLADLKQAAADQDAAKAVDDLIGAIGEVELTEACKTKIDDARKAYSALTDAQKKLVKNLATLTAAEKKYNELAADKKAVEDVIAKINAIGEVTLDSEAAIKAADDAFKALSPELQTKVTNADTLTKAKDKLAELKANKAAADAVIVKINAIGEVTLDKESDIKAARDAYDKLTDAQKELVTNESTLAAAEKKLAELKANKAAADAVIAKINAIGPVTKDSKDKIEAARAAYDKLTEAQKELVGNLKTLTDAEARYNELTRPNHTGNSGGTASGGNPYQKNDAKKDDVKKDDTKKSANTGDDSQLTLWLGGAVLSAAALVVLTKKRRQDA